MKTVVINLNMTVCVYVYLCYTFVVYRSIKARDQFYDDHKYDSKKHVLTAVA